MNRTIDYSFKEIKNESNGIFMAGVSEKKLKERMTQLENRYFDGRHIYHNHGSGSACLFRVEIKDLLLLLLRLDCGDILADGRTKQTGTTSFVLDQLFSIYDSIKPDDLLEPFERGYLNRIPQVQNAMRLLKVLDALRDEIYGTIITLAEIYQKFPSNEFTFLINRIKKFREMLIIAAMQYEYAEEISEKHNIPVFKMSENMCYLSSLQNTLDLREYVAQAINEIASRIYETDENGVFYRKRIITDDVQMEQEYENICNMHMRCSKDIPFSAVELPEDQTAGIKETRIKLLKYMQKFLVPEESERTKESIEKMGADTASKQINLLKEYIREYLILTTVGIKKFSDKHCKAGTAS